MLNENSKKKLFEEAIQFIEIIQQEKVLSLDLTPDV